MIEQTLQKLQAQLEQAEALMVVDRDGMVVASVSAGKLPADQLAAEYMDIVRRTSCANAEAQLDPVNELVATGSFGVVLYRGVTSEYGLLAVLGPRTLLGRARFLLRKTGHDLLPELEA